MPGYQKSHQNRVQNTFEKKVVQNSNFEWFGGRFLEFRGTKIPPNDFGKQHEQNIENQAPKRPEKHPSGKPVCEILGPPKDR